MCIRDRRTLCADIGRALGVPAHMSFLLRTASGPFSIEQARSVAELEAMRAAGTLRGAVISCEQALGFLPALDIGAHRCASAKNGLPTAVRAPDGAVRLYAGGTFLGVGRVSAGSARLAAHLYETERDDQHG